MAYSQQFKINPGFKLTKVSWVGIYNPAKFCRWQNSALLEIQPLAELIQPIPPFAGFCQFCRWQNSAKPQTRRRLDSQNYSTLDLIIIKNSIIRQTQTISIIYLQLYTFHDMFLALKRLIQLTAKCCLY